MIFKMAFRNIFRHKRRTIISILTIAVGIGFYIMTDSILSGIDRLLIEAVVNFSDSPIVIYSQEYDKNRRGYPLDKGITNYVEIENILSSIRGIEGITYRTSFIGEVIFGERSKYIVGTVIDTTKDESVFEIKKYISGNYLRNVGEVLIGKELARKMNVSIGDYITISVRTVGGMYNALDFRIVGLVESPNSVLNENGVIISYESANELLKLNNTKTSAHIKVRWIKGENTDGYLERVEEIANRIRNELKDYAIYTVSDLYKDFLLFIEQRRIISYIITLLVLLIAGVGITNNVLMSVYERIKEIGVLMSMGLSPNAVRRLFILEGMFIGILGGIAGMVLGTLLDMFVIYVGIDLKSLFGGIGGSQLGFPVWGIIYGEWNLQAFVIGFAFAVFTAIIFAYIPARYASKLKVTECLKFV